MNYPKNRHFNDNHNVRHPNYEYTILSLKSNSIERKKCGPSFVEYFVYMSM